MYLPSDEMCWESLAEHDARIAVEGLNKHLHPRGANNPLTHVPRGECDPGAAGRLSITAVAQRRLEFYSDDWRLFRFECDLSSIRYLEGDDLQRYERGAFLFAAREADMKGEGGWIVLDWTSAVIYQLNRLAGLALPTVDPGEADRPEPAKINRLRDYAIFFCSFLGGERRANGAIQAFLLPATFGDLAWEDSLPQSVDDWIGEQHYSIHPPLLGVDASDPPDLPTPAAQRAGSFDSETSPTESGLSQKEAVEKVFDEFHENVRLATKGVQGDGPGDGGGQEHSAAIFEALMWYDDALFKVNLKVRADGRLEMLDDEQCSAQLPIPRWEVRDDFFLVPLLCRQKPREMVSADELLARIDRQMAAARHRFDRPGGDGDAQPNSTLLQGLRVGDPVELKLRYPASLRLHDVEFLHDVNIDDAVFEHSVDLTECRFIGRLSARDTTIKGAFRLDESSFDGIDPDYRKGKRKPVIDLHGVVVDGGLFADRVTVFGRVRMKWARIGATLRARGLQIHPRSAEAGEDDKDVALDCSHARIGGPLDLRAYDPKGARPGKSHRRTVIGRRLVLKGLHASEVSLDGILVNAATDLRSDPALDMDCVCLEGGLGATVLPANPHGTHTWRATFLGDVKLSHGKMQAADFRGSRIAGTLWLSGLRLSGSLWADLWDRFRTEVGKEIVLSGARVDGDIELSAARIGGELHFITGRCARLRASVGAWAEPRKDGNGARTPRLCPTKASGILLQDLTVDAGVDLTGIKLRGQRKIFVENGFVAKGTRLGGAFRFWREDADVRIRRLIERDLAPYLDRHPAARQQIEPEIERVRAEIAGTLDLRGIHTGDSIDLGRCSVAERIQLENAHIGGNLRACPTDQSATCSTKALVADNACIEGDVDVRGLETRDGDFRAHGLRVTGKLWLATPDECKVSDQMADGSPYASIRGKISRIDLEGAHAAQLTFSGKCLDAPGSVGSHGGVTSRVILARCRVGQLSAWGFLKRRFPHPIDLTAIEVGDWNGADPFKNVPLLLDATEPFDGRNYIDVEQRLALVGKKALANSLYRRMRRRSACPCAGIERWELRARWRRLIAAGFHPFQWLWYMASLVFSGHGTIWPLIPLWLFITIAPVTWVLADSRNVEFVEAERQGQREEVQISDDRPYDLERDWNWIKGTGLALAYAIPLFRAGNADLVRARLNGETCFPRWPAQATGEDFGTPVTPPPCRLLPLSPHEFALSMSVIQFIIWVFLAANLPTILRRRQ